MSDHQTPIESLIEQYGYQPGEPVCILYRRNKNDYWVAGYEIFDPSSEVSVTNPSKGGYRQLSCSYVGGKIPVINSDGWINVKPTFYEPKRVKKLIHVKEPYTFDDVFNSFGEIVSSYGDHLCVA